MKRLIIKGSRVFIDLGVLSAAYGLAFAFRFELYFDLDRAKLFFFTWPYVVLFQYLVLAVFGVPTLSWRYVSIRDVVRILQAVGFSILVLTAVRLVLEGRRDRDVAASQPCLQIFRIHLPRTPSPVACCPPFGPWPVPSQSHHCPAETPNIDVG